eukprot:g2267.t1
MHLWFLTALPVSASLLCGLVVLIWSRCTVTGWSEMHVKVWQQRNATIQLTKNYLLAFFLYWLLIAIVYGPLFHIAKNEPTIEEAELNPTCQTLARFFSFLLCCRSVPMISVWFIEYCRSTLKTSKFSEDLYKSFLNEPFEQKSNQKASSNSNFSTNLDSNSIKRKKKRKQKKLRRNSSLHFLDFILPSRKLPNESLAPQLNLALRAEIVTYLKYGIHFMATAPLGAPICRIGMRPKGFVRLKWVERLFGHESWCLLRCLSCFCPRQNDDDDDENDNLAFEEREEKKENYENENFQNASTGTTSVSVNRKSQTKKFSKSRLKSNVSEDYDLEVEPVGAYVYGEGIAVGSNSNLFSVGAAGSAGYADTTTALSSSRQKSKILTEADATVILEAHYEAEFSRVRRALFKDGENEYYNSLAHIESGGNRSTGKGGAFFFLTKDEKFLLKTITDRELTVLGNLISNQPKPKMKDGGRSLLGLSYNPDENKFDECGGDWRLSYIDYIVKHRHESLMMKIVGCVSLTMKEYGGHVVHFLICCNIFPPQSIEQVDEKYDLKGSVVNRDAKAPAVGSRQICKHCHRPYIVVEVDPIQLYNKHIATRLQNFEYLNKKSNCKDLHKNDGAEEGDHSENEDGDIDESSSVSESEKEKRYQRRLSRMSLTHDSDAEYRSSYDFDNDIEKEVFPETKHENFQRQKRFESISSSSQSKFSKLSNRQFRATSASNVYCSAGSRYHEPMMLMKDNDLKHRIVLSKKRSSRLKRMLGLDTLWFKAHGIMDYSLLLGVVNARQRLQRLPLQKSGLSKSRLRLFTVNARVMEGPSKYYMGIIDILQKYDKMKKIESIWKRFVLGHEKTSISCVEEDIYASRFLFFLDNIITEHEELDVVSFGNSEYSEKNDNFNGEINLHSVRSNNYIVRSDEELGIFDYSNDVGYSNFKRISNSQKK